MEKISFGGRLCCGVNLPIGGMAVLCRHSYLTFFEKHESALLACIQDDLADATHAARGLCAAVDRRAVSDWSVSIAQSCDRVDGILYS